MPAERPSPRVAVCVSDARRRRIVSALDDDLGVRAFETFAALIDALPSAMPVEAIVLDPRDRCGADLRGFVAAIARLAPDASILLYATDADIAAGLATSRWIHDLILAEQTDTALSIRHLVFNAMGRRAADCVVAELRTRLPDSLARFAEIAVRFPGYTSVENVADRMGIHRQTAAVWTRKHGCPHPEELVIWARLLVVSRLLEKTDRSVRALAIDLEFSSVIALRNALKRYTGMTALEIRAAGFDAVLAQFDARLGASNKPVAVAPRGAPSARAAAAIPVAR